MYLNNFSEITTASKMSSFRVLKWTIPENSHLTSPDGVCILKLEKNDILVVWFDNALLICHISYNVNTEGFSFGKTKMLNSEFRIVDILQLGDVVGIFSKEMLYLLQYTSNSDKDEPSTSSRHKEEAYKAEKGLSMIKHISLNGVLMLKALHSGFVLCKRKGYKIFVDVYDAGLKMKPVTKRFSIQLPTTVVENSSVACVMTTVKTKEVDAALIQLLLQDLSFLATEIVFIGLGNGQVFYVPIIPKAGGEPRILYSTTQEIKGILLLRGPRSELYCHLAIILCNGPMICISNGKQKLHYETVYLPSSVHTFCQTGDSIVMGDGMDLWHCKLTFPADFEDDAGLTLENTMLKIKGVDALYYVHNAKQVLAVTVHLTLYSVALTALKEEDKTERKAKDFTIPSNLIEAINRQEEHLKDLHREIAHENQLLEVINISKCANLLRNSFDIDVQVNVKDETDDSRSSMQNVCKQYRLKIQVRNKSNQEFLPKVWSLHVMLVTKDLVLSETKLLTQKWSFRTNIETVLYIPFPISEPVRVICNLVAEISSLNEDERESDMRKQWVTIPLGEVKLDLSYFFELLPISTRNFSKIKDERFEVSQELVNIVKLHLGEGIFKSLSKNFDKQKELKEHVLLLTRYQTAAPQEIWSAVASNCIQQSVHEPKAESKMLLLIGNSMVKVFLNEDCTEMELRGEDLNLLHHVKRALMLLLRKQMSHNRGLFTVSPNLLMKTQKLKAQVHMLSAADEKELQELRQEWRNVISKSLSV